MQKNKVLVFTIVILLLFFICPEIKRVYSLSYENFNSYTEIDPNTHITLTSSQQLDYSLTRGETAYIYKDYGDSNFQDFEHEWDTYIVNTGSGSWRMEVNYGITNTIGSFNTWVQFIAVIWYYSGSVANLHLLGNGINQHVTLTVNTWYYLRITKTGTSVNLYVYSDSLRTNLVTSCSGTLSSDYHFRYIYGCASYNDGHPTIIGSAKTRNLNLKFKLFVTSYFNSNGKFLINNISYSNGSINGYSNNTILSLMGLPNSMYSFKSFNWTGSSTTTNYYNYTLINENLTIWCYFIDTYSLGYNEGYSESYSGGISLSLAVIIAIVISIIINLILVDRRNFR